MTLLYALLAAGLLAALWPVLPAGLHAPVAVYALVLASMAAVASGLNRWAALGGALFVCSDLWLAINRFHTPLPASALWVLPAYWAAQALIARSLPSNGGTHPS